MPNGPYGTAAYGADYGYNVNTHEYPYYYDPHGVKSYSVSPAVYGAFPLQMPSFFNVNIDRNYNPGYGYTGYDHHNRGDDHGYKYRPRKYSYELRFYSLLFYTKCLIAAPRSTSTVMTRRRADALAVAATRRTDTTCTSTRDRRMEALSALRVPL